MLSLTSALAYKVVSLSEDEDMICLGVLDLLPLEKLREIAFIHEKEISQEIISKSEFDEHFEELYGSSTENSKKIIQKPQSTVIKASKSSRSFSAIKPISNILDAAIEDGVSDVHFQPGEQGLAVRFRIDGDLQTYSSFSLSEQPAISSRLKLMCDMDIAETRLPQDSSMQYIFKGQSVDMRVSTLPGSFGEKIVLRILDKSSLILDLNHLGYLPEQIEILTRVLAEKSGIILLTGPTGSGKSTTLYAALAHLNNDLVNILTVEDPIEYQMEGITQTHHRSDIGYTFAAALRSMLRQDPDIIMVGEMRDLETAQIAFRSSLTGHLVLSTLHTNDALASIHRLEDMGIEPYIISSATRLIISQRLTKRLCSHCKKPSPINEQVAKKLGLNLDQIIYYPRGCDKCNNGYKGRTAISEMLEITSGIRALIESRTSADTLKEVALKEGFIPFREVAIQKLISGEISVQNLINLQILNHVGMA